MNWLAPSFEDAPSCNDPRWIVRRDNPWTAGCRWLQSWWREHELGLPPGPLNPESPRPLIASMLPVGSDRGANFLGRQILDSVESRLDEGDHSGIIQRDRLYRNLLSSQPTCFNAFGLFVAEPKGLLRWVRTIDEGADQVIRVRFEWAPDRRRHFGGGSAFDVVVEYGSGGSRRMIGVECKYAEDLAANERAVRSVYTSYTAQSERWADGAGEALALPGLWQFWLHVLLAQSITDNEPAWERATGVVMGCVDDQAAVDATRAVRERLVEPDRWLQWSSYEDLLSAADGPTSWREQFRRRYLDFTPVQALLRDDDSRRSG